jgi:putative membrane protein
MDERKVETAVVAVKQTVEQTRAAAENAATAAQDASAAAQTTTHVASRTAQAAETSAKAAQTSAIAAVITKDSAERRTEFAGDRTVLAAGRTYAAWVRTSMVGLAGGIGTRAARRAGAGLDGYGPGHGADGLPHLLLCRGRLGPGLQGRVRVRRHREAAGLGLIAVNVFLSLVGATALFGIWMGRQG